MEENFNKFYELERERLRFAKKVFWISFALFSALILVGVVGSILTALL